MFPADFRARRARGTDAGEDPVSFRAGRIIAALAVAGFMITMFAGSASAVASGTFSGTISPTSCGPMQDVPVVQGDTTIDGVAAEYVSANDIKLELYGPTGRLLVDGDTLTSPESVHYAPESLPTGTYHLQVCPFPGGAVTTPTDYTAANSATNGRPANIPGP